MEVYIRSSNSWRPCDLVKENHHTVLIKCYFPEGILQKIIKDEKQYRNSGFHIIKKRKNQIKGLYPIDKQ